MNRPINRILFITSKDTWLRDGTLTKDKDSSHGTKWSNDQHWPAAHEHCFIIPTMKSYQVGDMEKYPNLKESSLTNLENLVQYLSQGT